MNKPISKVFLRIGQEEYFTDNDVILPVDIKADGEFMLKLSDLATKRGYYVSLSAEVEE